MRRTKPIKREVPPDFRYQNVTVQSFINHIMTRGKKSTASRNLYGAFEIIQDKTGKNPIEVFEQALKNVGPLMEVRPRRVGGATYQVPMEVPADRRMTLAFRWLIDSARARTGSASPSARPPPARALTLSHSRRVRSTRLGTSRVPASRG